MCTSRWPSWSLHSSGNPLPSFDMTKRVFFHRLDPTEFQFGGDHHFIEIRMPIPMYSISFDIWNIPGRIAEIDRWIPSTYVWFPPEANCSSSSSLRWKQKGSFDHGSKKVFSRIFVSSSGTMQLHQSIWMAMRMTRRMVWWLDEEWSNSLVFVWADWIGSHCENASHRSNEQRQSFAPLWINRTDLISNRSWHRRRKRGGWGDFSPPNFWKILLTDRFLPAKTHEKVDWAPPKIDIMTWAPPPKNHSAAPGSWERAFQYVKRNDWTSSQWIDGLIKTQELFSFSSISTIRMSNSSLPSPFCSNFSQLDLSILISSFIRSISIVRHLEHHFSSFLFPFLSLRIVFPETTDLCDSFSVRADRFDHRRKSMSEWEEEKRFLSLLLLDGMGRFVSVMRSKWIVFKEKNDHPVSLRGWHWSWGVTEVRCLVFSSDEMLIASGSAESLKICNRNSCESIQTLRHSSALSGDHLLLIDCGNCSRTWRESIGVDDV